MTYKYTNYILSILYQLGIINISIYHTVQENYYKKLHHVALKTEDINWEKNYLNRLYMEPREE